MVPYHTLNASGLSPADAAQDSRFAQTALPYFSLGLTGQPLDTNAAINATPSALAHTADTLKRTYFAGSLPTKLTLIAIPLAALFAMLKDLLHL